MRGNSELEEASSFRPSRKPWILGILANVVLFSSLVLFPWLRGQSRAAEMRAGFAAYAACLWNGTAAGDPGLELPPGERARYASQVLHADEGWPGRCVSPLRRIPPDEALLLFPSVKQAEAQVRAAVDLVAEELEALARERREGVGRVPERPLLATGRLLATLSQYHELAGAALDMEGLAVRLIEAEDLPEPARVPLHASHSSVTRFEARADGLRATAVDRRGISRVQVGAGKVDLRRVRRPSLVRGVVTGPEHPWVVWAMEPSRCATEEDRCAHRAVGLTPLDGEGTEPPEPVWYAGHPAGRLDRVLHVFSRGDGADVDRARGEGQGAWMIAVAPGEAVRELRRFDLVLEAPEGETPPLPAGEVRGLRGFVEGQTALLVEGQTPGAVWSEPDPDGGGSRFWYRSLGDGESEPTVLAELTGELPYAFACHAGAAEGSVQWIVLGTADHLRVVRRGEGEVTLLGEPLALPVSQPISDTDPAADRVRIVCDADEADVAVLEAGAVRALRCDASRCTAPEALVQEASQLDLVRDGGRTLVAWSARGQEEGPEAGKGEVHVARLTETDGALGITAEAIPTACWRPESGFCGAPRLSARNGRVLLATRDRTDLLVVETTDGGRSWRAMRGIR